MRKKEETVTITESAIEGCDRTTTIRHSTLEHDSGLKDALIALLALILAGLTIYGGITVINSNLKVKEEIGHEYKQ